MQLYSGIPKDRVALGVNRLCGSGFQSIVNGAQDILVGAAQISLAAGTENMSQSPFIVRNARFGTALGASYQFEDALWVMLTDTYCNMSMAITGENLGVKYNIPRDKVDEYAARSQHAWAKAHNAGVFKTELVSVPVKKKGKEVLFETDEHTK